MRRLPLVGLVVSAVAHVVAVLLLIVIVERITSLPGLFIDLTTQASEPGDGSGGGAPPPKARPAAPGRMLARVRASATPATSARAPVVEPRAPEPAPPAASPVPPAPQLDIAHSAPPPSLASQVSEAAPVENVAPPSDTPRPPSVALPANVVGSSNSAASERGAPAVSTPGSSETATERAGRGSAASDSATVTNGAASGSGVRANQGLALATPSVGTGGAPGGGGPAARYAEYLARLRQRIQESLHYPLPARRRGLSGTVHLDVIIQPDGIIGTVTVVGSSSHESLDEAALETVRGLGTMPFPDGVPPRRLRVRVPVVFELR